MAIIHLRRLCNYGPDQAVALMEVLAPNPRDSGDGPDRKRDGVDGDRHDGYASETDDLELNDMAFTSDGNRDAERLPASRLTWEVGAHDIVEEFWLIQRFYRKMLKDLVDIMDAISAAGNVVAADDISAIFTNTRLRFHLDQGMYFHVMQLRADGALLDNMPTVILLYMPLFDLYRQVVAQHGQCLTTFQKISQESPAFNDIFACKKFDFPAMLFASLNRVPRTLVSLARLMKLHRALDVTPSDNLTTALATMASLAQEITAIRSYSGVQALKQVQNNWFQGRIAIHNGTRFLIRSGVLWKFVPGRIFGNKMRLLVCVLCDDLFLYGQPKTETSPVALKRIIPIAGLTVKKLPENSFELRSPSKSIKVAAKSMDDCDLWIDDIKKAIEMSGLRRRVRLSMSIKTQIR